MDALRSSAICTGDMRPRSIGTRNDVAGDSVADDVLSETFLVAFKKRDSFNTAWDDARPWLFGIATNLLKKHHRTEARVTKAYIRSVERPDSLKPMEDIDAAIDAQLSSRLIAAVLGRDPGRTERQMGQQVTFRDQLHIFAIVLVGGAGGRRRRPGLTVGRPTALVNPRIPVDVLAPR